MRQRSLDLVFLGLSLSSSWGNGHATTYRALLRGLAQLGHRVTFLERDVPWYASARDLSQPGFCELHFYNDLADLRDRFSRLIADADAVIVGSYVPDGIAVVDFVLGTAKGLRSFYDIDTPVTIASLERDACAYLDPRQIPALNLYLSFTGGPTLAYLAQTFGARQPVPFYCSVDTDLYQPRDVETTWDLGYLGTYAEDRQSALEALLLEPARRQPGRRFVVAGPQYPSSIEWPDNVDRIEHLPPSQHAEFYCRQRFTLNITRADMRRVGWSPSVRLFEAASCGTAIISDRWDGLTSLLPERKAVLIADETEDVVHTVSHLDHRTRMEIGQAARRIALTNHSGVARARKLEELLVAALAADLPTLVP